jgi:hypothetical protein
MGWNGMEAGTMNNAATIPPPPPGFVIEDAPTRQPAAMPAPPAGYTLQRAPGHFDFDGSNIPGYDPATGLVAGNDRPPVQPAGDPNAFDALGYALSQGSTFGLSDEVVAGLKTAFGLAGDYDQSLAQERANLDAVHQKYPWLSLAGEIGGGVLTGSTLARAGVSLGGRAAAAGKGWLTRLIGGVGDGTAMASAYGAGTGEGAADRANRAVAAMPYGAGGGLAGEALATGGGALLRRAFSGADDVARGANPAANVADARQFGIPLSRAQATRSVRQANIEDQLRSEGRLSAFDQGQREAVERSVGDVQGRLANGSPTIASPAAAYEAIPGRLRQARDTLRAESRDAYNASVNNPDVLVSGEAVQALPSFIRRSLDENQIIVDPMYHQGATRALQFIDDYLGRLPKPGTAPAGGARQIASPEGEVKAIDAQLQWIENLRASVRKNFPPVGPDAPALKAISSAIDSWTDDVFERGLVSASDEVLGQLKAARAKWSEYSAMADPKARIGGRLNPQYEAQRALRYITDKQLGPEEIGTYLWGSSVANPKNTSLMTAQLLRKQLGPDSPEWNAVRQSFWLRATRAGDETMNPARIAKNLDGMLGGNGASVAKALYSPEEIQLMRNYAGVMRLLTPAKDGVNHSNSANRLMPQLARYATGIMGALAGGGGMASGLDPLSAVGVSAVTAGTARALGSVAKASRAATATSRPIPAMPSGTVAGALKGGTSKPAEELGRRYPLEITISPPHSR